MSDAWAGVSAYVSYAGRIAPPIGPGMEPRPAPSDAVLREELARLLETDGRPDAGDALDVLWIARLSGLEPVNWSSIGDGTDPTTATAPPTEPTLPTGSEPRPGPDPGSASPSGRFHLPSGDNDTTPLRPGSAHAIRVSQPRALTETLSLARVLRPLRQTVPSTRARTLDVEATAAASGDTGLLLPVMRPATERRFSVDLLIDTGTTMTVWHRLADELRTLLARHGAFADVRAWALDTDEPKPRLEPFRQGPRPTSSARRWQQALADPAGRRMVLVLTDAVGPAWYATELPATLADWSRRRPVAALHVLPSRLWHRTALRTSVVRACGMESHRATLEVRSSDPLPGIDRGRAGEAERAQIRWLPVLEVSDLWLRPWACLVAGRATDWTPLQAAPLTVTDRPRQSPPSEEPSTPAGWIEHFEEGYSPEAFRLLRLLAAAPLSLPVMRLVQRTMLPASTPTHLAEVFLSGLLVRRTPAEPGEDPDSVTYDFRYGVREALLDRMTRTESLRVLRQVIDGVSERVASTLGGVTDFRALVVAAAEGSRLGGVELSEGSRAFAEVALAVIKGAGGDYAEVAARLAPGSGEPGVAAPDTATEEKPGKFRRGWQRLLPWRRVGFGDEAPDERWAKQEAQFGYRYRSTAPPLPTPYVRPDQITDVVNALIEGRKRCVIGGPPGVGKTTLAAACADMMASDFTMVRWMRAVTRETLVAELRLLALDLGLASDSSTSSILTRLHDHLRAHPGWLLIYDGVTSDTIEGDPEADRELNSLWLPPEGHGSLLVTLSEGAWPDIGHVKVTLHGLSLPQALEYLEGAIPLDRGDSEITHAELTDLADVLRGNPRLLSSARLAMTQRGNERNRAISSTLVAALGRRQNGALRSLVWISHDREYLGTGIAVRPDTVLTTGFNLHTLDVLRVHQQYGSDLRVVNVVQDEVEEGLVLLQVDDPVLSAVAPSPVDGTSRVAAWFEAPESLRSTTLRLSPESSGTPSPPPGAMLLDADGRSHAMVVPSLRGRKSIILSSGLIERLELSVASQPGPEARPERLVYFVSYARSASSDGQNDLLGRFFTDLHDRLARREPRAVLFTDAPSLAMAEAWSEQRLQGLAEASVVVLLLSPEYIVSDWARREWTISVWRQQLQSGDDQSRMPVIVPVLWAPVPTDQLPSEVRQFQVFPRHSSGRFAELGLLGLMEDGEDGEYEQAVEELAFIMLNATREEPR